MLIISKNQNPTRYNKPIYGLTGIYTLSEGVSLPYFSALLDIDRAIDELRIAEQIPASLDTQWSIKELFQREIDEKRIELDIIKSYLLDPKKLKFFNAITIVLMPKGGDDKILDSFIESEEFVPPAIPYDSSNEEDALWNQEGANHANFGGVQFVSIGLSARLRWDEDRVLAVAVDGQHRLWSLRTFRESPKFRGGTLRSAEKQTKIPVIFVLLHESAGFQVSQGDKDYSIRSIARELFTDLNKNAKTVDRARELILDDRNITAQCVRTLVTEKTSEDSDEVIPLSLVRWQEDSNRFDTSYYLNSLVHLDLLVSELLDLSAPKDPMEKSQVLSFINSVNTSLGVDDKEVEFEGRPLSSYYLEDCCDEDGNPQTPLSRLPDNYLQSAVEGFKSNFRPWLLKLLLEFLPYRNLLDYARERNLICGEFGSFHAQTSKHRSIIKEQENTSDPDWHRREILEPERVISSMKSDEWAFKAIFQKAMVRLGKMVEFQSKDKNLGNVGDLLEFFNRLYKQDVLKVYTPLTEQPFRLWTFIAINPGNDKIKVARAVEDRIFYILSLWYFGTRKLQIDASTGKFHSSTRKLLNFFSAGKSTAQWPDCKKAYEALYRAFDTSAFYGRDSDNITEEQKKELVLDRFARVFATGLPDFPKPSESELVGGAREETGFYDDQVEATDDDDD